MYPFSNSCLQNNRQLSSYGYAIPDTMVILPSGIFFIAPNFRCAFSFCMLSTELKAVHNFIFFQNAIILWKQSMVHLFSYCFLFSYIFTDTEFSLSSHSLNEDRFLVILNFMGQQPDKFWLYTDSISPAQVQ